MLTSMLLDERGVDEHAVTVMQFHAAERPWHTCIIKLGVHTCAESVATILKGGGRPVSHASSDLKPMACTGE